MSASLSLSQTTRAAQWREREFTSLYRIVLIIEALTALALLFASDWMAGHLGLPAGTMTVIPGMLLLWSVLFQLPGLMGPVHARTPIIIGLIGRLGLAIALATQGLWVLAAMTLLLGLAIGAVFLRMAISVLMSRP